MMQRLFVPVAILVVLVLLVINGAFYQVDETEQVIITQFGEPVGGPITTPGLKAKVPFIQTVRRFDKRVLEWDGSPDQIPTLDKRFILVDATARWRIADPLRFLQSVGDQRSAQSRLDDLIDSAARDVVSAHRLIQVVRNFERELPLQDTEEGDRVVSDEASAAEAPEAKSEAAAAPTTAEAVVPADRLGRNKLT